MSKWCTSAAQGSLNEVKLIFHRTWLLADDELSPPRRRCVPYNLLGVLRWQWHSRLLTQRRFSLRGCSPLRAAECSGAAGLERERGLGAPDHPLSAPPTNLTLANWLPDGFHRIMTWKGRGRSTTYRTHRPATVRRSIRAVMASKRGIP